MLKFQNEQILLPYFEQEENKVNVFTPIFTSGKIVSAFSSPDVHKPSVYVGRVGGGEVKKGTTSSSLSFKMQFWVVWAENRIFELYQKGFRKITHQRTPKLLFIKIKFLNEKFVRKMNINGRGFMFSLSTTFETNIDIGLILRIA